MNNIEILTNAFAYIERKLQEDIKTEDVAHACFCSRSTLDKIFKYVNNMSVHDYVIRRRMMLAARMILSEQKSSLLDIAIACGYSTNESFTRAFRSVWNCNPSEFRSNTRFSELFPRLHPPIQNGGTYIRMRRNVDISELYELFKKRKDCYFICCDIKKMEPINAIARKAGDLAILETMDRLEQEAGEEDIVFRIGGDEFVILTNRNEIEYAENIADRIRSCNGQTFSYEEKEIPLSLYVAIVKYEGGTLRYRDLFEKLHIAIMENKVDKESK